MFGAPAPNFKKHGQAKVKKSCGACDSLLIFTITLLIALVKLEFLALRTNMTINTNKTTLEAGELSNTVDEDLRMAFSVTYMWERPESDPRYTQ